jgi:hypothetical protein
VLAVPVLTWHLVRLTGKSIKEGNKDKYMAINFIQSKWDDRQLDNENDVRFVLDQHALLLANWKQFMGTHVAPLGHITQSLLFLLNVA